jgi:hypothetical protein
VSKPHSLVDHPHYNPRAIGEAPSTFRTQVIAASTLGTFHLFAGDRGSQLRRREDTILFVSNTNGVVLMAANRILAPWIGHADVLAMTDELPEAEREKLLALADIRSKYGDRPAPLRTASTRGRSPGSIS